MVCNDGGGGRKVPLLLATAAYCHYKDSYRGGDIIIQIRRNKL